MSYKGPKPRDSARSDRPAGSKGSASKSTSPMPLVPPKPRPPSPRALDMGKQAVLAAETDQQREAFKLVADAAASCRPADVYAPPAGDLAAARPADASDTVDDFTDACYGGTDSTVRTPWGVMACTHDDDQTRDPLEPDDPVEQGYAAGHRPMQIHRAQPSATQSVAPMTPRELYELLMSKAADHNRSSPLRIGPDSAQRPAPEPAGAAQQADMILSAIEAGRAAAPKNERRAMPRRRYRVKAALRLHSDQPGASSWILYTRDVHARGLGFITAHRLPLGYGGTVELPDPDGGESPIRIGCTLLRCREAAPGWYEGSLYFNREVPRFNEV